MQAVRESEWPVAATFRSEQPTQIMTKAPVLAAMSADANTTITRVIEGAVRASAPTRLVSTRGGRVPQSIIVTEEEEQLVGGVSSREAVEIMALRVHCLTVAAEATRTISRLKREKEHKIEKRRMSGKSIKHTHTLDANLVWVLPRREIRPEKAAKIDKVRLLLCF